MKNSKLVSAGLAAMFIAPTVCAADDTLSLLGYRLGGMVIGTLSVRLQACDLKDETANIMASIATASYTPAQLQEIMEGVRMGAARAATEADGALATPMPEDCDKLLANMQTAASGLAGDGVVVPSTDVVRKTHRECLEAEDDTERLACHDLVARATFAPKDGEELFGSWLVKKGMGGVLFAEASMDGEIVGAEVTRKAVLLARCRNGETELIISYGEGIGRIVGDSIVLIDGMPVVTLEFLASSFGGASFWPDRSEPLIPFLKRLAASGARSLGFEVQIEPEGEGRTPPPPSRVSISLDGFAAALKPIAQECQWR